MADGASLVSTSTRRRSAVSCELRQTSSACCSGESSAPNAAWMPPCAFAELHDCTGPLAASATRAPALPAETAAARPEAPLPITSTSKDMGSATVARVYQPLMSRMRIANEHCSRRRHFLPRARRRSMPRCADPLDGERGGAADEHHRDVRSQHSERGERRRELAEWHAWPSVRLAHPTWPPPGLLPPQRATKMNRQESVP